MLKIPTIPQLFHAYDKAEYALARRRDKEFPEGTKVIFAGMEAEVVGGSLYADQILTNYGHMSWRCAKKVTP